MKDYTNNLPNFYRQKFLLVFLDIFGGEIKKVDFQKYLFISTAMPLK